VSEEQSKGVQTEIKKGDLRAGNKDIRRGQYWGPAALKYSVDGTVAVTNGLFCAG